MAETDRPPVIPVESWAVEIAGDSLGHYGGSALATRCRYSASWGMRRACLARESLSISDPLPGSPIEHGAVSISGSRARRLRTSPLGYGRAVTVRELLDQGVPLTRCLRRTIGGQLSTWGCARCLLPGCHPRFAKRQAGLGVRRSAGPESGRRRICAQAIAAVQPQSLRNARPPSRRGAVDRREGCTAHAGVARSGIFQHPSRQMSVVGITGTNGKTTTSVS